MVLTRTWVCLRANLRLSFQLRRASNTAWTDTEIACWHPEQEFPYEHSRPIVRDEASRAAESIFKVQHFDSEENKLTPDGPTDKDLMRMFHTPKYTWYIKPTDRYKRLQKIPKEREHV